MANYHHQEDRMCRMTSRKLSLTARRSARPFPMCPPGTQVRSITFLIFFFVWNAGIWRLGIRCFHVGRLQESKSAGSFLSREIHSPQGTSGADRSITRYKCMTRSQTLPFRTADVDYISERQIELHSMKFCDF